jgi:hypothetical protein
MFAYSNFFSGEKLSEAIREANYAEDENWNKISSEAKDLI